MNKKTFTVAVIFMVGMVYNECHKRKRKHLDEVNKYKIP